MTKNTIYATYFLYNAIFIEQKLDSDEFGDEEQQEIINISSVSFLAIQFFIKNNQDIIRTQRYIKDHLLKSTLYLDTLQDIIALDNNINSYLDTELDYFSSLGQAYYQQSQQYFLDNELVDPDSFFSSTMFYVEVMLLLDQSAYSIDKSLQLIEGHEYEKELSDILKTFQLSD
ncbi:MAG: hypothetical protein ACRCWI_02455 [Brevinema sp.]